MNPGRSNRGMGDPVTENKERGGIHMLDGRRQMQIFKTIMGRLTLSRSGPPDSYTDEEKKCYLAAEQEILENRKTESNLKFC